MDTSINGVMALAVEALLAAGLSDSLSDLTRLDHGRSGAETYLLEVGISHYVLRIQTSADQDAEAARFVAAQRAASDVGVAPRLLASIESGRAVLSERVVDVSFLGAVHGPSGMAVLANLGEKLATLHAHSSPDIGSAKPPILFIAAMMEKAAARWPLPSFIRKAQADFEKRNVDFPVNDFCHLDLNPSNILFDGDSVWLGGVDKLAAASRPAIPV